MSKDLLKTLIRDFHLEPIRPLVKRDFELRTDLNKIVTVTGARRSGKSSLLLETVRTLRESHAPEQLVYLNFEDERLELQASELNLIIESYRELYPEQDLDQCFWFFDEIQNVSGWEKFVRRLDETISKKIFVTGSNSKLLSSEIATSLRGRSLNFEVFPLSFAEFLRFKEIEADIHSSKSRAIIRNAFDQYLQEGGFPEVALLEDPGLKRKLLVEYFDVMIYRDLLERYQHNNLPSLKFFLKRCLESVTSNISINKIYNDLKSAGFRIGKDTLYQYLDQATAIYLLHIAYKYDPSVVRRELGIKKVYVADNGLLSAQSWAIGKDKGKLLENLIAVELRRQDQQLQFADSGKECDFIFTSRNNTLTPIQVSYDLSKPDTKKREVAGLISGAHQVKASRGTIITHDSEETLNQDGIEISITPAWRYLLSGD